MADLDALLKSAETAAEKAELAAEATARRAADRSHIARLITWAFVIMVGVVIAGIMIGVWFFNWDELSEASKVLVAILSSVMLPVVTLVIGYYFGQENQ